jgi:hypothetical protein
MIALPDELSAALAAPGQDLSRAAFEALALAAYRERKISADNCASCLVTRPGWKSMPF